VAAAEHAGGCGLGFDLGVDVSLVDGAMWKMGIRTLLLVFGLVGGVGRVGALESMLA